MLSGHLKAFELLTSRAAAAIVPPPPMHPPGSGGTQGGEGGGGGGEQVAGGEQGGLEGGGADKTPLHAAAECGSVAAVLRWVVGFGGLWGLRRSRFVGRYIYIHTHTYTKDSHTHHTIHHHIT